ncbi:MAG: cytochrome P450 [Planctomycetales bacterium]
MPSTTIPPATGQLQEFDPFAADFAVNRYAQYRQIVRTNPVHYSHALEAWVLATYAEVSRAFRDLRLSSRPVKVSNPHVRRALHSSSIAMLQSGMLGYVDPPVQPRLRGLIKAALDSQTINSLSLRVQTLAEELFDALQNRDEFDLVSEVARPLAVGTIANVLGIAAADVPRLERATPGFFRVFDPLSGVEAQSEITAAIQEFRASLASLIGYRRQHPDDGVLSRMVHGIGPELRLSDNDIIANCVLLFASGQESPANLIANGTLALLQFPEQWEKLRARPELIPQGVEELLRLVGPSQFSARMATADYEVAGRTIPKGEIVFLLNAAANRDPARFDSPDLLDLERPNNHHLSFGLGVHHCMGTEITRLQARIFFQLLSKRCPKLSLPPQELKWKPFLATHGLQSLILRR